MHINGVDVSELDPLDAVVEQEVRRYLSLHTPGCAAVEREWPYHGGPPGVKGGRPSVRSVAVGGLIERVVDPRSADAVGSADPRVWEDRPPGDRGVLNLQRVLDFLQVDDVPGLSQVLDVADRLQVGRRPRRDRARTIGSSAAAVPTLDLYAWLMAWRSA